MGYVYRNVCGVLAVQDEATINEPKVIRFIDPHYRERFTIPDGDQILIRYADGEKKAFVCRFIDEYHVFVGHNSYHICQFAEVMERIGAVAVPFPEKRVIWQNIDLDLKDWDGLREDYPDYTEAQLTDEMYELNNQYLDDERSNLKIQCGTDILVIGDIGRWNGRVKGYKLIESGKISDCLSSECDMVEWYGMMKISKILTERKRKNACGEVSWGASKLSRILHNSTYKGYQAYLKSFSNNFLEQKRINNHNKSTYMYVKGAFPPIISEEQWDRVQKKMSEKTVHQPHPDGKRLSYGKKGTTDRWLRKLKCNCGSGYRKNLWHRNKSGAETYGYQCYNQLNHGTKQMNEENGLPTDGMCGNKMVTDWKLDCMASEIFSTLAIDKKDMILNIFRILNDHSESALEEKKRDNSVHTRQLEKLKNKLRNLINMRADGEISKEDFAEMKAGLEEEIKVLTEEIEKNSSEDDEKEMQLYDEAAVAAFLDSLLSFSPDSLDKDFADRFVHQIIQQGDDHFAWVLNLDGSEKQTIIAKIQGRKGKGRVELNSPDDCCSTKANTTHKQQDFGGETKKDDSDEDCSSSESSNYTYKSISIGHSFVKSELVDLFQGCLSSSKTCNRNTER